MSPPLPVTFVAGLTGTWRIDSISPRLGAGLAPARRLGVTEGHSAMTADAVWVLSGVTSNIRYATAAEAETFKGRQQGLGRAASTRAALIPISKSDVWWGLAQDVRRRIFEETSRHTRIGMDYLPAIARRLHHCRDLGGPFDFLTWFEYTPDMADAFERLCDRLRATEEWTYVVREVDIRLSRAG